MQTFQLQQKNHECKEQVLKNSKLAITDYRERLQIQDRYTILSLDLSRTAKIEANFQIQNRTNEIAGSGQLFTTCATGRPLLQLILTDYVTSKPKSDLVFDRVKIQLPAESYETWYQNFQKCIISNVQFGLQRTSSMQ